MPEGPLEKLPREGLQRPHWSGHLAIARTDHWIKNVFVLPGIVVALSLEPQKFNLEIGWPVFLGLLATCLIASSNYTLNEVLDAPFDRRHPLKRNRPVPAGLVSIPGAYLQWLGLMVAGIVSAWFVSLPCAITMVVFWLMGCIYNVPPMRSKDLPYLDVVSEAVNNPLRFLAGWWMVQPAAIAPASLVLSYWMIGCYFMALKRFAELRSIDDAATAAAYRKSFSHYTPERLLVSVTFYGSAAMLFFGAFIMRYRMELILAFPLVALVMAIYMRVAFKEDSTVQAPERLFQEKLLMCVVLLCTLVLCVLLFLDLPLLYEIFAPTAPLPVAVL